MPDKIAICFLAIEATSIKSDMTVYRQTLPIMLNFIPSAEYSGLPDEYLRDVLFTLTQAHFYEQE